MSNIKATKRESLSSGSNNKLRAKGLIPAILYGGKDPNAKIYNRDGQEVLNDGSIIRDEDIRTDGPIIDPNTLLQIGGAAGGLLRLLINPFGGNQLAKLPHTPPTEKIMLPNGKMIDSPLRFKTDEQRERFMQDFSKGFGRYS